MRLWGMTTGNVLKPVIVDSDGHLQIDLKSIQGGNNLIGRVDARDGDKIFSFKDILFEQVRNLESLAGTNILEGAVCPANEIWMITSYALFNIHTAMTASTISVIINNKQMFLKVGGALGAGVPSVLGLTNYLKAGDYVKCYFYGCTVGDDIYMHYNGYKMSI